MSSSAQMTTGGHVRGDCLRRELELHHRIVGRERRAQRRGAVVVARPPRRPIRQTSRYFSRVGLGQPAAALARQIGRAHAGEERPEAGEVVLARSASASGRPQEVHVGARRLLRGVWRSSRRESRRVRRIEITRRDRLRTLRRQAPGERAAPVGATSAASSPPSGRSATRCRRRVLAAIRLDVGRRRRSPRSRAGSGAIQR